jgi:hypothetical protein
VDRIPLQGEAAPRHFASTLIALSSKSATTFKFAQKLSICSRIALELHGLLVDKNSDRLANWWGTQALAGARGARLQRFAKGAG